MEQEFRTTFLVLEDDANDALLIRRAFTNSCCQAFVCRNTSEARAYLLGAGMYADRQRFPFPEIVITDIRLGDESGVHFMAWLRDREEFANLPIIVLTGSATPREIKAAKELGASRVITKPGDPIVLQDRLIELSREFLAHERVYEGSGSKAEAPPLKGPSNIESRTYARRTAI